MDLSLTQIEEQLKGFLKEKNQIAVDTLRGLKTRITNEQIAKGAELSSEDITALVRSEVKRRKEAAEAFTTGGRSEAAAKEQAEMEILNQFLPAQMSEDEIAGKIDALVAANGWTAADFGKAMGTAKQEFGSNADGAVIAKVLKEKLK